MSKKWLVGLLIAFQLSGCNKNDTNEISPSITTEPTVEFTVAPTPTPTPQSTFDPYDVYLRHSPLETMDNLIHLEGNTYYLPSESPGRNLALINIYDFDNMISEVRLYTFENGIYLDQETLKNKDYLLFEHTNYLLNTVDTYKDEITHTENATCHLDYKNSSYYPDSEDCAQQFEYNEDNRAFFIEDAILSYKLGDSYEDEVTLSRALRNDPKLQDEYINLIFDYFKEN